MYTWKAFNYSPDFKIKTFYTMFCEHFTSDYYFQGEVHDFWECAYVIDGDISVSADERIYNMTAGDIVFHKPMELHKFTIENASGATLFIFTYVMEGRLCSYFMDRVFSLTKEQRRIISDLIFFTQAHEHTPDKVNIHQLLLTSPQSPQLYLGRVVNYVNQLFLSLAENARISSTISTPETAIYKAAIGFMQDRLDSNPTVREIAKYCKISESGLKRIFTKYAGMSVHKYFLNLKLNAAIALLQSGKTVTEVTDLLNFSSQSYLSVAFKRELGTNPSKFKN